MSNQNGQDLENPEFLAVNDNYGQQPINPSKPVNDPISNDTIADTSSNKKKAQPFVTFFAFFFKGMAIGLYIFGGLFMSSFILRFILIILFTAFDFWTIKNVTGRLLVGLRWWNEVKEDGSSEWKYESRDIGADKENSRLFWLLLYITPIVWAALLVFAFIKLNWSWLPLCIVGVVLNGSQFYGYYKCHSDYNEKLKADLIKRGVSSVGGVPGILSMFSNFFTSTNNNNNNNNKTGNNNQ